MIKSGTGVSRHQLVERAARQAAEEAMRHADIERADAVLLFATVDHCREAEQLLQTVIDIVKTDCVVGCSGYGVITEEAEVERSRGVAVQVLASDQIQFEPFLVRHLQESSYRAGQVIAQNVGDTTAPGEVILVFPDTLSLDPAGLFAGIEQARPKVQLVGGAAGEDGFHHQTFQWAGREAAFNAVSGFRLRGDYHVTIGVSQSCVPIDGPYQITRAEDHVIWELDGEPASQVFLEFLRREGIDDVDAIQGSIFLGLGVVDEDNLPDSRVAYITRNIVAIDDEQGCLVAADRPVENRSVWFLLRHRDGARGDLEEMLEGVLAARGDQPPAFGWFFNCCARGSTLYGRSQVDISTIQQYLGRWPLAGVFTYGEIAPIAGVNAFHNHSAVLVMIDEGDDK